MKMHHKIILLLSFCLCAYGHTGAEETEAPVCEANEVKVCFHDGGCFCKVREIQPIAKAPDIDTCVDEDDSGDCSE